VNWELVLFPTKRCDFFDSLEPISNTQQTVGNKIISKFPTNSLGTNLIPKKRLIKLVGNNPTFQLRMKAPKCQQKIVIRTSYKLPTNIY